MTEKETEQMFEHMARVIAKAAENLEKIQANQTNLRKKTIETFNKILDKTSKSNDKVIRFIKKLNHRIDEIEANDHNLN